MTRDPYTPPADAADVFDWYKQTLEDQAELKPKIREFAVREMRENGATTADLARLTGLSDEFFRRIARAEGIERLREPTVRRLDEPEPPAS